MNAVEARRLRQKGELGDFTSPTRVRGHVTFVMAPNRVNFVKGGFTDYMKRVAKDGPRTVLSMLPAAMYFGAFMFYINHVNHKHHMEQYY